jgi:hypothetical protein
MGGFILNKFRGIIVDSVDIRELVTRFSEVKGLDTLQQQKLSDVFESIEDGTDSALKILIPLLLAYSDKDNAYGKDSEKLIRVSINESNRIRIVLDAPIGFLDVKPGNSGIYHGYRMSLDSL